MSLFSTSGATLRLDDPSYVERQADHELTESLLQGEYCYVLTSRQMGKSSLMLRAADRLRRQGRRTVSIDLTALGQTLEAEQWYYGLTERLSDQLQAGDMADEVWARHEKLPFVSRFFHALRQWLVSHPDEKVVIFIDEIDTVLSFNRFAADEFFAALRECFTRRVQDPHLERVSFCLLGVATPSDLIQDERTTPFNIGRCIHLADFTEEEARPYEEALRQAMGEPNVTAREARIMLQRVLYWTGGHPYLTQRLCGALVDARRPRSQHPAAVSHDPPARRVDRCCAMLFFRDGAHTDDNNLAFVRDRILRSQVNLMQILTLYDDILRGRRVWDDETNELMDVLRLSGIVRVQNGRLLPRNRIYQGAFNREWVRSSMPDAELREREKAYRRGVVRAAGLAAGVVLLLSLVTLVAVQNKRKAQQALAQSEFLRASALSNSDTSGQRVESLKALQEGARHDADPQFLAEEYVATLALPDLVRMTNAPGPSRHRRALALDPTLTFEAWSPEGESILIQATGAGTEARRLWLPPTGLPVEWIVPGPGARFIAAQYRRDDDVRFVLWNVRTRQRLLDRPWKVRFNAVDFSRNGQVGAVGVTNGTLQVYSLTHDTLWRELTLTNITGIVRDPHVVRLDASGRHLAEAGPSSLWVTTWDLDDLSHKEWHHDDDVVAMAWGPHARTLATATARRDLTFWDLSAGIVREIKQGHTFAILDLQFSPDGNFLASVGEDLNLKLWVPALNQSVTYELTNRFTGRLHFAGDPRSVAMADPQRGIRQWRAHGFDYYQVYRTPLGMSGVDAAIDFDPSSRVLFVGNAAGAFFWDVATAQALPRLDQKAIRSGFFHDPTGDFYLSTTFGFFRWPRQKGGSAMAFGPQQSYHLPNGVGKASMASMTGWGLVRHLGHLHKFQVGNPLAVERGPGHLELHPFILSACGRWLAGWDRSSQTLRVREMTETLEPGPEVLEVQASPHVAFTPGSRLLVACREDGQYLFWETESWKEVPELSVRRASRSASGGPVALAGHATGDGWILACADGVGEISLYQIPVPGSGAKSQWITALKGPLQWPLRSLTFSPDSLLLAAERKDNSVEVWNLAALAEALAAYGVPSEMPRGPRGTPVPLTFRMTTKDPPSGVPENVRKIEEITQRMAQASGERSRAEQVADLWSRARLYDRVGRCSEAIKDLQEALQLDPDHQPIQRLLKELKTKSPKKPPIISVYHERQPSSTP